MANYTTTITNEGAALLASVIANQGTLTFNEFRFSENDYTGQESTLTEGTFLGVFITASAAASVIDSTTIKTSAQFNNSTITGNHNLYSIGIVGTDGNTTALIAVCTTTDPDVIREPLTGTSTYAFNVNLSVSDTSQITVTGTTAAVLYDADVVDTLISTATDKPLSANQGRVLKDNIDDNFSGQSNENLIDNPWFTVNQRGQASYTDGQYSADRWKVSARNYGGSGVTVNSNGVTIAFANANEEYVYINQKFENSPWKGKTVTVSLIANGVLYTNSFNWTNGGSGTFDISDSPKIQISWNDTTPQISIISFADAVTFRAVKLELGSVSTLANDVEPNYTTELLKCRRCGLGVDVPASALLGFGNPNSATTIYVGIPLPVPLRADPAVNYSGVANVVQGGTASVVTDVTFSARSSNYVQLVMTSSGMTVGQIGSIKGGTGGFKLFLDSDL